MGPRHSIWSMIQRLAPLLVAASCAVPQPVSQPTLPQRPLDTLPTQADIVTVRGDLIASAGSRFGKEALDRAMAAPAHLIAKRFVGMAPPPPTGAGSDWRPPSPTALVIRDGSAWLVATGTGWRPAKPEAVAELNTLLGDARLWSEPPFTPPCPDYGANLLLLKLPGKTETVRNSLCDSVAARIVLAALNA